MKNRLKNLFRNTNPAVLIIVAFLFVNNMLSSPQSPGEWIKGQLLMLPGIIIGLTLHEAAHGYVSYWLGDPTPKLQGRLSLNPFRHIDPLGFCALFFAGFGWGQPVEINPFYYKHKRVDELLVAIAGVVTNLTIAVISSVAIKSLLSSTGGILYGPREILFYILYYMMIVNVMLMLFNLLPVPPLDGFGIITQVFNLQKYRWYYPLYNNGFYILMFLIFFDVIDKIFRPLMDIFINLLI